MNSTSSEAPGAKWYPKIVLAMLLVSYTLNYVDRQIVAILAQAIKKDLALTDVQLGLLGGFAFAFVYTVLGIPVAWLADRLSRVRIVTVSIIVWSVCTALCGMVGSFPLLVASRLGVGVGEAGGFAPSTSIIADYFRPRQRATAVSIFTLALPLGSGIGLLLGGYLAAGFGWRAAFQIIGATGVVIAPMLLLVVREPARGQMDLGPNVSIERPAFHAVLGHVAKLPTFWLIALGSATSSMQAHGLGFWLPSLLQRSYAMSLRETSVSLGIIALTAGTIGILLGGIVSDRFGRANPRHYASVTAVASLVALPALLGATAVSSKGLLFALLIVPQAMGYVWAGPSVAVILNIVPPSMRAIGTAIYLFVVNLIGLGVGTLFFGVLSSVLTATMGNDSLYYSILIGSSILYPVTALLYFAAAWTINRDWSADDEITSQPA